jgi:hypothetical protein
LQALTIRSVALVRRLLALVRRLLALVRRLLALVRRPVALVGLAFARVGSPFAPLRRPAAPVRRPAALAGRPLALIGVASARIGDPLAPLCRPLALVSRPLALVGRPRVLFEPRRSSPAASKPLRPRPGSLATVSCSTTLARGPQVLGMRPRSPGGLTRTAAGLTFLRGAIASPCLLLSPGVVLSKLSAALHLLGRPLKDRRQPLREFGRPRPHPLGPLTRIHAHPER